MLDLISLSLISIFPAFAVIMFVGAIMAEIGSVVSGSRESENKLSDSDKRRLKLSEELAGIASDEERIKEQELSLVNVYEITKKMSGSLTFDGIFNVFSAFLNDNFSFRTCDLLILNREGVEPQIGRRYRVLKGMTGGSVAESPVDYRDIIKLFEKDPKALSISRSGDPRIFNELNLRDDSIETFLAVPLLSDRKVAAILTFQNVSTEDFEKFIILSIQFALEIKKVLLYETVERLSVTDSLTGLYVRRYFFERFEEELQRSKSYKLGFAFIMIDIDNFKKCNDTYGHLVGDVVLKEVARLMKENLREIDLIARYGGEEFAMVLPETGPAGAKYAAERIRKRIEDHTFKAYDEKLKVTISAGTAVYPDDADNAMELVERADSALYKAKRSGKNVVCEYTK